MVAVKEAAIPSGTRSASAEAIGLGQVIPPAFSADLNDVTREVAYLSGKAHQLGLLRDASTVRGQSAAENVRHVDKRLGIANRARLGRGFTQVLCGPQKFWMSIANV